ncbi:MAG: ABC transporter permease [Deltaproteobacteria bacterium]|nr:ABC transporter permease [Deltaproteobacteria bacterium]
MSAGHGFEWFVAWRHLRDPERRSRRAVALKVGLAILLLSAGILVHLKVHGTAPRDPHAIFAVRPDPTYEWLRIFGVIGLIAGFIITFLGSLLASFTVFTAISVFGVFLGTAAPILALSVMSGFEADLKGKIRGAKADVVVTMPSDDERPFLAWQKARATILRVPGVSGATPYLEAEVMVRSGASPAGVVLRGIDPGTAASVLDLGKTARECTLEDLAHPERVELDPLSPEDSRGAPTIILGEELYARTLRVFPGSLVDVVCPLCKMGPSGPMPGLKQFRVAGHFYSGMYEFDSKLAYVSLAEAQAFLRMPGEVTGIDVRTDNPDRAPRIAAAIQSALGPGYEARSWEELNKGLFMALRLEKIAMFVVLTFIALVASFSIVSTLIMMATEKAREIAILKAMGAEDGAVERVFVAEGLYIGVIGLLAGVASGVVGCLLIERYGLPLPTDIYYITRLPVVMRTGEIVIVAALALGLCFLATVYPAYLAARMRPIDGLRYE